jgi:signal-transduction protein with cAMP-binding, CBS, and nucleotidyltransferase domain
MDTVKKLLQVKGNVIYSISAESSVYEALEKLESKNLGSLVVLEDNGTLDGIFTERDYARKVILKGRSSRDTKVRDIMTEDPIFVTPETKIDECMQIMVDKYIRHLPVMENNQVIGLVSIGDLVRYIIEEKDYIIQNLEHFIVS